MRLLLVVLSTLLGISFGVRYDGYRLYLVTTNTGQQNEFLNMLRGNPNYDFWSPINTVGKPVTIMASPKVQAELEKHLKQQDILFEIPVQDVESIINAENEYHLSKKRKVPGRISFDQYYRHAEMNAYLDQVTADYPDLVTLINIGKSYQNRTMNLIRISTGESDPPKPVIFVDAGIHAREWIAPSVALYLINQLVENQDENRDLIEKVDWVILPNLNPDGYEYTWDEDRLWRKSLSPGTICDGTDINRNFAFHWGESGATFFECAEDYPGTGPFSEVEARNLRDILNQTDNIRAYLTLHSCGQYLLYPWGYDFILADNADELDDLGHQIDDAIASVRGTRYTVGNSAIALYPAAGASDDWSKSIGVDVVYTIELPCGDEGYGFVLDPSEILPVSVETFEGFKVVHNHIVENYSSQ